MRHVCAVFCAKLVADRLTRGIFETYLTESCVPFIPEPLTSSKVASVTNALTVRDVMATGVTALPPVVAASRLVEVLKRCAYAVRRSCLPLQWALSNSFKRYLWRCVGLCT